LLVYRLRDLLGLDSCRQEPVLNRIHSGLSGSKNISNLLCRVMLAVFRGIMVRAGASFSPSSLSSPAYNLHLEQHIIALVQVLLGHANAYWKGSARVQPAALYPRLWDIVTALVHNMVHGNWDSDGLSSKSAEEAEAEEMHSELGSLVRSVQH
jgi:hypothetical protein